MPRSKAAPPPAPRAERRAATASPPPRKGIDRRMAAQAALRLLNETGLEELTLRRIAEELDVKAPALYWHFTNKQALLDEMATEMFRVFADRLSRRVAPEGWRERLRDAMQTLRATLLAYRDGARVFAGTRFTGIDHADTTEAALGVMVAAGFTPASAARAWFTAYSYTVGFVIEEQAVYPAPGERDPRFDVEERRQRLSATHPLMAAVGEALFTDYDTAFDEGLTMVITGIDATLNG